MIHSPSLMLLGDIKEAEGFLDVILDALAACFAGAKGKATFNVRETIGDARSKGEMYIRTASLGKPLLACFNAVGQAGATWAQFNAVHQTILAQAPVSLQAVAVCEGADRMALSQMARLTATMTFESRDAADQMMSAMDIAFGGAEETAADEHSTATYQALLSLHAAVTRDLAFRAMSLPDVINLTYPAPMPSLWLSNRLYQNAIRAGEIRDENKVVHPLFCPRALRVISK